MADDEGYDLKPSRPESAPRRVARPNQPAPSAQAAAPQTDPETIKNFQIPLTVLLGGAAIDVFAAIYHQDSFAAAITSLVLQLVGGTAVMLVAVLIAARIRGIQLGSFGTSILKLAAVYIAPSALVTIIGPAVQWVPFVGGLIAPLAAFVLTFALLGVLFDLEESDTWYCLCIIFLMAIGIHFVLLWRGFK